MHIRYVDVPLGLLRCSALTPAAKLLWITLHLDAKEGRQRSHAPTHLARRTGLARSTVYAATERAAASGWLVRSRKGKRRWRAVQPFTDDRRNASLPVDLVTSPNGLRPQALVCYGLLQTIPGFKGWKGKCKWAEFKTLARLHLKTVKRAVSALVRTGWATTGQKNRLAPIEFRLRHADEARKEAVERRLERKDFKGEGLMQEILSVTVDSDDFADNYRPRFLVNPQTGERLELDRYYPMHKVAFEFNGRQHYVATERFSKQEVAAQKKRDAVKRQICKDKNIALVIVHAEDLSLAGMLEKVKGLLPLRDLSGYERTLRYLEDVSRRHRKAAARSA